MEQLTIRKVPRAVGAWLREKARRERKSLNSVAVEALTRGAGLGQVPLRYLDMEDLAGKWAADPACDRALAELDTVDEEAWR